MSSCWRFSSAPEKDHKSATVPTKINSVAGSEVNAVHLNASSDAFGVREISLSHSRDRDRHLSGSRCVATIEPFCIGAPAVSSDIFKDLNHDVW